MTLGRIQRAETCPAFYMRKTVEIVSALVRRVIQVAKMAFSYTAEFLKRLISCQNPCSFSVKPKITARVGHGQSDVPPEIYESVTINLERISEAPKPFNIEALHSIARIADPKIKVREFLTQFDELFESCGDDEVLFVDDGIPVSKKLAREKIITMVVDYIQNKEVLRNYNQLNARYMEAFLIGVIFELRKGEIPAEKKQSVVRNIAIAAYHCTPRLYEVIKQGYLVLTNQIETVDEILLSLSQKIKEDLYVNYYSLSSEPVQTLNFIRREVGLEQGLDQDPVHIEDIYINSHDARSPDNRWLAHTTKQQFRETFKRIFTTQVYMNLMKDRINEKLQSDPAFVRDFGLYMRNQVMKQRELGLLENEDVENLPEPYQFPYDDKERGSHLTDEGIRFLLVDARFLNSKKKNGHLVRVTPRPVAKLDRSQVAVVST